MTDISPGPAPALRLTTTQWLICIIAAIGFAFDIYELLMLPLIIKPAIAALSAPIIEQLVAGGMPRADAAKLWAPGGEAYLNWARTLFFVPAIAGGVFGLLGGYLTDRLGRRRVLTGSILLYAFSACAAGYATNLWQLLALRCGVFIGVSVEFVAAVAWLAELFPNPTQREKVLGYTQAFSSIGGVMVAAANGLAAKFALDLPAIHGAHDAWRYTLISGVIPAIPLLVIRPFLPESPVWQRKKEAGTLKRASIGQLFSPALRKTTLVTTAVFACSYGIAFGAIQQMPQILGAPIGGHKEVAAVRAAAEAKVMADAEAAGKKLPPTHPQVKSAGGNATDAQTAKVAEWQEIGGLLGRVALAILALIVVSRRWLFRIFQLPALLFVPAYFYWLSNSLQADNLLLVKIGIAVCGFLTVAQFSFWGNYIPLVFPVHLRGTGEGFAANIGGRIFGTLAAFITLTLAAAEPGKPPSPAKMALMSALVAGGYALLGAILTQFLPEPKPEDEHDEPVPTGGVPVGAGSTASITGKP
jgi:MFS family permease